MDKEMWTLTALKHTKQVKWKIKSNKHGTYTASQKIDLIDLQEQYSLLFKHQIINLDLMCSNKWIHFSYWFNQHVENIWVKRVYVLFLTLRFNGK